MSRPLKQDLSKNVSPELLYPASRVAVIFGCVPFVLFRYQNICFTPNNSDLTELQFKIIGMIDASGTTVSKTLNYESGIIFATLIVNNAWVSLGIIRVGDSSPTQLQFIDGGGNRQYALVSVTNRTTLTVTFSGSSIQGVYFAVIGGTASIS